jgi:hypothetical protein
MMRVMRMLRQFLTRIQDQNRVEYRFTTGFCLVLSQRRQYNFVLLKRFHPGTHVLHGAVMSLSGMIPSTAY